MEMQHEAGNRNMVVTGNLQPPMSQELEVDEDPEIQGVRKDLLIFLGVFLSFDILSILINITGTDVDFNFTGMSRVQENVYLFITFLFDGFGVFVAYQYSATGLRVFAFLNIIFFIFGSITTLYTVWFGDIASSDGYTIHISESERYVISLPLLKGIVLCCIAVSLGFLIIIVRLAFKLAKLIQKNRAMFAPLV